MGKNVDSIKKRKSTKKEVQENGKEKVYIDGVNLGDDLNK